MKKTVLALVAMACAFPALAEVKVEDAWVRATVAPQKATGAFMRLTASEAPRLVGAESPAAGVVEVHEMRMENDMMMMSPIEGLDLPAGETVELKPGGYHIMLMELPAQVEAGKDVPITLKFQNAAGETESMELAVPVRPIDSTPPVEGEMDHGAHDAH